MDPASGEQERGARGQRRRPRRSGRAPTTRSRTNRATSSTRSGQLWTEPVPIGSTRAAARSPTTTALTPTGAAQRQHDVPATEHERPRPEHPGRQGRQGMPAKRPAEGDDGPEQDAEKCQRAHALPPRDVEQRLRRAGWRTDAPPDDQLGQGRENQNPELDQAAGGRQHDHDGDNHGDRRRAANPVQAPAAPAQRARV